MPQYPYGIHDILGIICAFYMYACLKWLIPSRQVLAGTGFMLLMLHSRHPRNEFLHQAARSPKENTNEEARTTPPPSYSRDVTYGAGRISPLHVLMH